MDAVQPQRLLSEFARSHVHRRCRLYSRRHPRVRRLVYYYLGL